MSNRGRRASAAGLLAALILMVGLGETAAAKGIIVTHTTLMPVKDPLTEYDFQLSLSPNILLIQGDYLKLADIPDYNGTSSYVFKSGGIDYSPFFTIVSSPGSSTGLTDIELMFSAGSPLSLSNPSQVNDLPIGDLFVETTVEYAPPPGSPLYDTLSYTSQTHTYSDPLGPLNFGSGTTTPQLVPEPAGLVMLGVGLTSAWLLARHRRRPAPLG